MFFFRYLPIFIIFIFFNLEIFQNVWKLRQNGGGWDYSYIFLSLNLV